MRISWQQQLELQPELRDFTSWPMILSNEVPTGKRSQFNRNIRIIAKILAGDSITKVARLFALSKPRINQILQRCLSSEPDCPPPLTVALIPGQRIKLGKRKCSLSDLVNPSGTRGSFSYVLDTVPGLKKHLDDIIRASIKRGRFSQNLSAKFFNKEFLRYLSDSNWPVDRYPFDQQTLAYESCRLYLDRRRAELSIVTPKPRRVISTKGIAQKPYQEVQIDSQTQDVNVSIVIEDNGSIKHLRVSRVTLFLATDVATDCRLAYHLCLTKDPTELDLLSLLEKIHSPWEPMVLETPGLAYEPGACLPSALGEDYQNAGINLLRLDNALCHMSHAVRSYVCEELDTTLNFGLPAHPKGRNFVEHAFKLINEYTHRFASTTGSHPTDVIKETKVNASRPPELTLRAFKECLSVLLTTHNVTPQERLGGHTPLQMIEQRMVSDLCRISFSNINSRPKPFCKRKLVSVKHVKAAPHINFMGLRYNGDCLAARELIKNKVNIEYDQRDIRVLNVFSVDGNLLGEVKAPRTWQNRPISVRTKKKISRETRTARFKMKDPLGEYFSRLSEKAHKPKHALEMVRLYEESFSYDYPALQNAKEAISHESSHSSTIPSWSPKMVRQGGSV